MVRNAARCMAGCRCRSMRFLRRSGVQTHNDIWSYQRHYGRAVWVPAVRVQTRKQYKQLLRLTRRMEKSCCCFPHSSGQLLNVPLSAVVGLL